MKAINGKETNTVEVVKRLENLSETSVKALPSQGRYETGADIDRKEGGGYTGNANYDGKLVRSDNMGSHIMVVMDSEALLNYSDGIRRPSDPGEIFAHELIGHGLGGAVMSYDGRDEAIQAGNLYLQAIGKSYYRQDHGVLPNDSNTNPRGIPIFLDPVINPIGN